MKISFLSVPMAFTLGMLAFSFSACKGWDSESKQLYLQACDEEAQDWMPDAEKRKAYCDCALDKTMHRYEKISDALAHTLDDTVLIQQMRACRAAQQ